MLEIQRLRSDKEGVLNGLLKRNIDSTNTINEILDIDSLWRSSKTELESIFAELNQLSRKVGLLLKEGHQEEASQLKLETTFLKEKESTLKLKVEEMESKISALLYSLPNVPHEDVAQGKTPEDNEQIERYGDFPTFAFTASPHRDLVKNTS